MLIIKPWFSIGGEIDGREILRTIESIGRTCYKSENRTTDDSAEGFVRRIIKSGHESVIEHVSVTVRVVCDRGVSHEIVRHRIASYSQESTRYCNYTEHDHVTFIMPFYYKERSDEFLAWRKAMQACEDAYFKLIELGSTPQEARGVLPNSLKTEIVITYNLREWRHFFRLRCSSRAHPQMREIAIPMLGEFKKMIPVVFDDLGDEAL